MIILIIDNYDEGKSQILHVFMFLVNMSIILIITTQSTHFNRALQVHTSSPYIYIVFIAYLIIPCVYFQLLIRSPNCKVDARMNDGTTPLIQAVRTEVGEMVEELIRCEADINAADNNGTKKVYY